MQRRKIKMIKSGDDRWSMISEWLHNRIANAELYLQRRRVLSRKSFTWKSKSGLKWAFLLEADCLMSVSNRLCSTMADLKVRIYIYVTQRMRNVEIVIRHYFTENRKEKKNNCFQIQPDRPAQSESQSIPWTRLIFRFNIWASFKKGLRVWGCFYLYPTI